MSDSSNRADVQPLRERRYDTSRAQSSSAPGHPGASDVVRSSDGTTQHTTSRARDQM